MCLLNHNNNALQSHTDRNGAWKTYLKFGTAAAACIGGGTLYGNGSFAATAGFSNNMICVWILFFTHTFDRCHSHTSTITIACDCSLSFFLSLLLTWCALMYVNACCAVSSSPSLLCSSPSYLCIYCKSLSLNSSTVLYVSHALRCDAIHSQTLANRTIFCLNIYQKYQTQEWRTKNLWFVSYFVLYLLRVCLLNVCQTIFKRLTWRNEL